MATPTYILVDVSDMSERHVAALEVFIDKFKKGAAEHGDLRPNKDWSMDRLQEQVDKSFYEIFELIDLVEARNGTRDS